MVDPEGRYPASGLRRVEEVALHILSLYGGEFSRTRDVIQIDIDGDTGIVVLITPEIVELRLPTVEWTGGAYDPAVSSRRYKRLSLGSALVDKEVLETAITEALQKREREFIPCRFCGKPTPPEQRHGKTCHPCGEKHLGVAH